MYIEVWNFDVSGQNWIVFSCSRIEINGYVCTFSKNKLFYRLHTFHNAQKLENETEKNLCDQSIVERVQKF